MVAVKKSLFGVSLLSAVGVFCVAVAFGDVQQQVAEVSEHVSLLQTRVVARSTAASHEAGMQAAQSSPGVAFCVPLVNYGSYSTVPLDVGQPPQRLAILADTGSSAVIVTSCECSSCVGVEDCYDRSTSSTMVAGKFEEVEMSFGSGNIMASVITDVVTLGAASVVMERGLLEMIDQRLHAPPLEGILGLGPPMPAREDGKEVEKSFLLEAGVNHFSFCLKEGSGNSGGVLEVDGTSGGAKKLANSGSYHWALGLNGISVGDDISSRLPFCSPSSLTPGQQTPCGAIPDSGTTMITGPKSLIMELMSGMCDAWPRCATAAAASPSKSKEMVFEEVLHGCGEWAQDFNLDEMPALRFHLSGADGSEEPVEISPWAYVMEMHEAFYQSHVRSFSSLLGVQPEATLPLAGYVCAPAFEAMEMNTETNGPVWILGTSLFYDYTVHYDMNPKAVSFVRGKCGDCSPNSAGSAGDQLLTTRANGTSGRQALRRLAVPPRLPQQYKRWHGVL